jgi:predicted transposase YbfD/YdcC
LWQDLQALTMVFSERQEQGQEKTAALRYSMGSRAAKAKTNANSSRRHWGLENGLPGVLAVCFDADGCRMRTEHSPENLAWLGRLAWCLLKKHGGTGSIGGQRLPSGWNEDFLLEILSCK